MKMPFNCRFKKLFLVPLQFLLLTMFCNSALAITNISLINKIDVYQDSHGIAYCNIYLDKQAKYKAFTMNNPARVILDFENTSSTIEKINTNPLTNTALKNIRIGRHENHLLRMVFDVNEQAKFRTQLHKDSKNGNTYLTVALAVNDSMFHALDEQIKAEEQKKLEQQRQIAEQKRLEEQKKLEEQKRLEEQRKAEEQKKLEQQRQIAEQKRLEEQKKLEEQKRLEEQRKAEEQKKLEQQRQIAEQKRLEEQKKLEEQKRLDEQRKAEEQNQLINQLDLEQKTLQEQKQQNVQKVNSSTLINTQKTNLPTTVLHETKTSVTLSIPLPTLSLNNEKNNTYVSQQQNKQVLPETSLIPLVQKQPPIIIPNNNIKPQPQIQVDIKNDSANQNILKTITTKSDTTTQITTKNLVTLIEPNNKQKNRNIVIVIDAGHGGKDPGARGLNGAIEKDITLAIAKNLQSYISNEPNFKVILTRNSDYFISLKERLNIAHKNKADLFVSIHADAYKHSNGNIKGTTLFALSPDKATSDTARLLAEESNAVEKANNPETDISLHSLLLGLAQKASIQNSIHVGQEILSSLTTINYLHAKKIEQANFLVLQSPDIPSLLIESGFVSDSSDEKKLLDPLFQEMFAKAVGRGIINYFKKSIKT